MPSERRWRDLPPMEDAPKHVGDPEDPFRVSQTFLRIHDRCERSAALYVKHDGGPGSHPLERGSVFHEFAAKAARHLIGTEERELPSEVALELLAETFAEHFTAVVPASERRSLRMMANNFAAATVIDPERVVALESTFTLKVGKWTVRGRIDLAELAGPARIDVTDYKTSFAMLTQEEFEGDFQTMLYALAVAFGELEETGLRLGAGVEQFGLRQSYPRYLTDDGLANRFTLIDRRQLIDFRLDLETQLRRLESNIETGRWQAVPGSHCGQCVSPAECPLPRHLRPDSQMAVATIADAEKMAEWIVVESDRTARAKKRLKAFAASQGLEAIDAGTDLEFRFVYEQRSELRDLDELMLAAEGAAEYGHPFNREDHLREKKSTTFKRRRKVKPPREEE